MPSAMHKRSLLVAYMFRTCTGISSCSSKYNGMTHRIGKSEDSTPTFCTIVSSGSFTNACFRSR